MLFLWSNAYHKNQEGTSMSDRVLHPPTMGGRWPRSGIYGPRSRRVSCGIDPLPKEAHWVLPQDSDRCRMPCHPHTSLHSHRAGFHIHQCSPHTAHLGETTQRVRFDGGFSPASSLKTSKNVFFVSFFVQIASYDKYCFSGRSSYALNENIKINWSS